MQQLPPAAVSALYDGLPGISYVVLGATLALVIDGADPLHRLLSASMGAAIVLAIGLFLGVAFLLIYWMQYLALIAVVTKAHGHHESLPFYLLLPMICLVGSTALLAPISNGSASPGIVAIGFLLLLLALILMACTGCVANRAGVMSQSQASHLAIITGGLWRQCLLLIAPLIVFWGLAIYRIPWTLGTIYGLVAYSACICVVYAVMILRRHAKMSVGSGLY